MQSLIIPETDSWVEQRAILVMLKFLAEQGTKDGFIPLKPIKIKIDGVEMTYEQLQNIDPRTTNEIKIVRLDKNGEKSPFLKS